jgi:hypothetical protein
LAPALTVQGAIEDRVRDRGTQSRLVGLPDRSRHDKLTRLRSGENGRQPFLCFCAPERGRITAPRRLLASGLFALLAIASLPVPPRTRRPTYKLPRFAERSTRAGRATKHMVLAGTRLGGAPL